MENAARALQIAASVLISVMILTLVVMGYNNLSETKRMQQGITSREQAEDFNKQFEPYNKKLYGIELIALSNMIDDYTKRYPESEGYDKITYTVDKSGISNANTEYPFYFGTSASGTLSERNKALEEKIKTLSAISITHPVNGVDKTFTYINIHKQNEKNLKLIFGNNYKTVIDGKKSSSTEKYSYYVARLTEQKDFARLEFENVKFEYNSDTGRINKITIKKV